MSKLSLIFMGPPGSGKGTQAKLLAGEHNFSIFESGKQLRSLAATNSQQGLMIQDIFKRGLLVPNQIVNELFFEFAKEHSDSEIVAFDGFPRTFEQAKLVIDEFKENRKIITLSIELSDDSVRDRLLKRVEVVDGKETTRSDDNIETINKRIEVYNQQTAPVLDLLKNSSEYFEVDGEPTVEEIHLQIQKILEDIDVKT